MLVVFYTYMAKPNFPEKQTAWGTWEDLLLACAVHRYGADSWDSVASELQKRLSSLSLHHLLTPFSCKQKYLDLRRRFASQNAVVSPDAAAAAAIPFLDELRRLRVAELRREVERYDLSIVSLESKVEKLKEEREQSLGEGDERAEKADLKEKNDTEEETGRENASPEVITEKAVSGDGSFDESNSTNLKDDGVPAAKTGGEEPEAPEPDRARECGKPTAAVVVEDSYDGSSDTIAKGSAAVSPVEELEKVNVEKEDDGGGGGGGGGDSAESKGGEEGAKEVCSSEMRSWTTTSLSRKKGEEPDAEEDQSIATRRAHRVESKSLGGFLETLRSHKCASFFERRREIQKTPHYITMIRQHIDFEMVRFRLEEGWYAGCKSKFFRDVLLVLNNAIVFFGKKSPESIAAFELRLLVLKEMAKRTTKRDSLKEEEARASKPEPEEAEQPSDMLLRKPKLSVPMNACRKRSSITARAASTSSSGPERKKEQTSALLDVKPAISWKQSGKSSDKAEFPNTTKKRKDRSRSGTKNNSNKSSASRSNGENKKILAADSNAGPSARGGTSNENSASKSDKKNNSSNASGKKQSVTNFLNRMKRGSSSNNGSLLETLKDSANTRSADQKNGSSKGNKQQKEQSSSRKASNEKHVREQESPSKRSVGRPSKRPAAAAAAATPPAKRSRQSVETEVIASRNAKRTRK